MKEPVRVINYIVVVLGALLGAGGITDVVPDTVLVWLGIALVVLTAVLTEVARSKVTPLADPHSAAGTKLVPVGSRAASEGRSTGTSRDAGTYGSGTA